MALGDEHLEEPPEPVDGTNVSFTTAFPYQPGTLFVWRGGQLIRSTDDDGFVETGAQTFETRIPWLTGDTLTVRYLEDE